MAIICKVYAFTKMCSILLCSLLFDSFSAINKQVHTLNVDMFKNKPTSEASKYDDKYDNYDDKFYSLYLFALKSILFCE